MPLTYTHAFDVRFYECDANGHLNNTQYVRFMQEAALHASAAAGYDLARYRREGRVWWIVGTEIEYLAPAYAGDRLQVQTWVADFRRASSRRMYEFRRAGEEALIARGFSDWMFLDTNSGRFTAVPPGMIAAFLPEGAPEHYSQREPFPEAPSPPSGAFTLSLPVRWRDLDTEGHVNNAVYLDYIEECGFQAVTHFGWPWERMREAGFGILLRKHQVRYYQPALPGETLEIKTWASNARRSTAIRHYEITRAGDGALIARVHSLGVWVELASGRPIRIPPEFLRDFAPNIL